MLEQVRHQGGLAAVATNQGHTVTMGLVDDGDDIGSTMYRVGGGIRFLPHWGKLSDEEKERFRAIIITDTEEVRVCARTPRRRIGEPEALWALKV